MFTLIVAIVLVAVATFVALVSVVMGQQGYGSERMPGLARHARTLSQHLNGEAEPPRMLVDAVQDPRATMRAGAGATARMAASAGQRVHGLAESLGQGTRQVRARHASQ